MSLPRTHSGKVKRTVKRHRIRKGKGSSSAKSAKQIRGVTRKKKNSKMHRRPAATHSPGSVLNDHELRTVNKVEFSLLNSAAQCRRARLPRQYASNCWLNACITSFFASQGMSAVGRPLRLMLRYPERAKRAAGLTPAMKFDLRRLAKVIESIPTGRIGVEYSTAALISGLLAIDRGGLTTPRNKLGAPAGQGHNPIWMYSALAKLLLPGKFDIIKCDLTHKLGVYNSLEAALDNADLYNFSASGAPLGRVLFIEAGNETAESSARDQLLRIISNGEELKARGVGWKLDSVVMRDTLDNHFGGIVTCDAKPHSYDGMTGSELHRKQSWRQVVDQFKGRKIPTPSRDQFKYNIHTGYTIFAFVPSSIY